MDSIEVQFLGQRSDTLLILAGAAFRLHTRFHIGFGIPNHFAQQFCELRGMLGLFPGIALERLCDLGITFAVSLAAHRQIHAHLGAFAHKMILQALKHLCIHTFCHSDHMFVGPGQPLAFDHLFEFRTRDFALRAKFGCCISFVNVTANGTNEFLFHNDLLL